MKIVIFVLAIVLTVSLFVFFYRIEYGNMSDEEKKERLERFEKYNY